MNAGKTASTGNTSDADTEENRQTARLSPGGGVKTLRERRVRTVLALAIGLIGMQGMHTAWAQDAALLDDRVTQHSVADTICRPGYADAVSPSLDSIMARKDRMLAKHGIDAEDGTSYALDRRVPIVLGGSPDAAANFELRPWAGHAGERRKELLTARLKRCVCAGRMTLAEAQAAIVGNWPSRYGRLGRRCEGELDDGASASAERSGDNGS